MQLHVMEIKSNQIKSNQIKSNYCNSCVYELMQKSMVHEYCRVFHIIFSAQLLKILLSPPIQKTPTPNEFYTDYIYFTDLLPPFRLV